MKKIRILSVILCMVLVCSVLSGCVGHNTTVELNEDGSGKYAVYFEIEERCAEVLKEIDGIDVEYLDTFINACSVKEKDGKRYRYIEAYSSFDNLEGFENIKNRGIPIESGVVLKGIYSVDISKNENNKYIINLSPIDFLEIYEMFKYADEEDIAEFQPILDSYGITYEEFVDGISKISCSVDIKLPYDIVIDETTYMNNLEGLTISGNNIHFDYVKYATSENPKRIESLYIADSCETFYDFLDCDDLEYEIEENPFVDISKEDWYFDTVLYLYENGIIKGMSENTFNPNDTLTYAQYCKILTGGDNTVNSYWAYDSIKMCVDNNIIEDLGEIVPENYDIPISREVAIAGLRKVICLDFSDSIDGLEFIVPNKIGDYDDIDKKYVDDIVFCYSTGIINGVDDNGTFLPKKSLTRAEFCKMYYNAENLTLLY